jgi:hypothetical protein
MNEVNPDVFFFTASDSEALETSHWVLQEYWVLTRDGGPVQKIWRIDPRTEASACEHPVLMWERGRDKALPKRWECPVTEDDGSVPNLPDPWAAAPPSQPPLENPPLGQQRPDNPPRE